MLILLVFFTGLTAGTLSGMVDLGGGILSAPLLLFLPELLGFDGHDHNEAN